MIKGTFTAITNAAKTIKLRKAETLTDLTGGLSNLHKAAKQTDIPTGSIPDTYTFSGTSSNGLPIKGTASKSGDTTAVESGWKKVTSPMTTPEELEAMHQVMKRAAEQKRPDNVAAGIIPDTNTVKKLRKIVAERFGNPLRETLREGGLFKHKAGKDGVERLVTKKKGKRRLERYQKLTVEQLTQKRDKLSLAIREKINKVKGLKDSGFFSDVEIAMEMTEIRRLNHKRALLEQAIETKTPVPSEPIISGLLT